MKIRYDGPRSSVNVVPYGEHPKGKIKEYPDEFGEELLATSKTQRFEIVEGPKKPGKGKKTPEPTPLPDEGEPSVGA
jgi:hypothetical protein